MDLEQLKKDTKEILVDVLGKSRLRQGQILVLGMSSSEVAGGQKSSMSFRVSMQGGLDNSQLSSILRILWRWNLSQPKPG